ncbi:hypothetical protein BJX76DRAFT_320824 [Aspergillus varians]
MRRSSGLTTLGGEYCRLAVGILVGLFRVHVSWGTWDGYKYVVQCYLLDVPYIAVVASIVQAAVVVGVCAPSSAVADSLTI